MSDIKTLSTLLSNDIQEKEALAVPVLVSKLNKLAELHPSDQTIGNALRILSKAANNKTFITRAEFKDMYKRLYSRNTKFADYFADELGTMEKLAAPKYAEKHEAPITDLYAAGNSVLAAVLKTGLDKKAETTEYSKEDANKALTKVNDTLNIWSVAASKLEIIAGDNAAIIVRANYETPKGIVGVLVPVEIKNGYANEPKVFVGHDGPYQIDHTNIKNYLTKAIEAKVAVVGRPGAKELEMPKGKEMESFAEKFNTPLGVATFKFGADKVNLGRDAIVRTLAGFGVDHPQISILASESNTVVYGVSVGGKVSFKVPVKIANNKVLSPELIICNGSIMTLNKANINGLFVKNETDYKVAASTSPAYGLKVNELLDIIREAAAEHNYTKAEDALNVLEQSGNEVAFKQAAKEYMDGLLNKTASAPQTSCSMVIKSGSSQHPTCGHTGLPLHKVFQDKYGNCQPLYRKEMPETYEAATFNTAKILG